MYNLIFSISKDTWKKILELVAPVVIGVAVEVIKDKVENKSDKRDKRK